MSDKSHPSIATVIEEYEKGPRLLRDAIKGMSQDDLNSVAAPGTWSTHRIVCHITDFEIVNSARIHRVMASEDVQLTFGDPQSYAVVGAYSDRVMEEELDLIERLRRRLATMLRAQDAELFERECHHSVDGAMTLRELVERITRHIPHHVDFIMQKRQTLGVD